MPLAQDTVEITSTAALAGGQAGAQKVASGLLAKDIPHKDEPCLSMTPAEFLAKAWKLTHKRARDLCWVV